MARILIACSVLHPVLNDAESLGLETQMNILNICILSPYYRTLPSS